jgi:hypothetical protein
MKFNCMEDGDVRDWHRWFAWYPVHIGPNDCRWLETVERSGTFYSGIYSTWWDWEYRPISNTPAI